MLWGRLRTGLSCLPWQRQAVLRSKPLHCFPLESVLIDYGTTLNNVVGLPSFANRVPCLAAAHIHGVIDGLEMSWRTTTGSNPAPSQVIELVTLGVPAHGEIPHRSMEGPERFPVRSFDIEGYTGLGFLMVEGVEARKRSPAFSYCFQTFAQASTVDFTDIWAGTQMLYLVPTAIGFLTLPSTHSSPVRFRSPVVWCSDSDAICPLAAAVSVPSIPCLRVRRAPDAAPCCCNAIGSVTDGREKFFMAQRVVPDCLRSVYIKTGSEINSAHF
jgi:hypothetical protein